MIYSIPDLEHIGEVPGVYVFARLHGRTVCPLYVGKAENLQRRIAQQLNNLKLMRGIQHAPKGLRTLHVAELVRRPAQYAPRVIKIIESALISSAMVEGFDLLNTSGTKALAHSIVSTGNREARRWLPESEIKLRRASD